MFFPSPQLPPPPPPVSHQAVLRDPAVRQRIIEYLGGDRLDRATCTFLGRLDPENLSRFDRHPPSELDLLLDQDCELARSLEDRESMLVHLDIEYVNFDAPAVAYVDPVRVFRLQQPLVEVIETALLGFGIRYLHLVTGQGHHFVWKFPRDSAVARHLSELGVLTPMDAETPVEDRLFGHLALLMESFAHLIKSEASPLCDIPVEITACQVGPGVSGTREMLSIDISEYGDPLSSRMIRIPYTAYRKPWVTGLIGRLGIQRQVCEFFTLPLHETSLADLLRHRHRPDWILPLARRAGVMIPTQERGTARLLDYYRHSPLAAFHREFYSISQDSLEKRPPGNIDHPLEILPPCAAHVLNHPNDLLLKPSAMQLVTRCLLARHWHPRHIAGLIRSKFTNPEFGWNGRWFDYDPSLRAEFYTRLFSGKITLGLDRGTDFNCFSQQEKLLCWNPHGCSLEPYRKSLQEQFPLPPPS